MATARATQKIIITKGKTKSKVSKNISGKRGNPHRCPTCGRFR